MRCNCCDRILSDAEATSKFVDSGLFTEMCKGCQGFLPKEIRILTRSDLVTEEEQEDYFDFESAENDEQEEE